MKIIKLVDSLKLSDFSLSNELFDGSRRGYMGGHGSNGSIYEKKKRLEKNIKNLHSIIL